MKIENPQEEESSSSQRSKVAVVQAAPVAFDRERTLEKVHILSGEAACKGARLVLFPEAFVSAYPRGLDFGSVIGSRSEKGREDFRRYWESSVDVPGPVSRATRNYCEVVSAMDKSTNARRMAAGGVLMGDKEGLAQR